MLAYTGVNLKVASLAHKEAKAMGKVIMKAKGHIWHKLVRTLKIIIISKRLEGGQDLERKM